MTMGPFSFRSSAVDARFGRGRMVDNVIDVVNAREARRILVVASPSQSDSAQRLASALGGRVAGRFADVVEHVPAHTVTAAVQTARDVDADLVLSIGGGSTTGTAKAIALHTGLPIVAVPTTLAGSEMTDIWGVTTDGRKRTGKDPAVIPRAVVYDSALLDSLPAALAVTSGFNALAHCVEAFWGPGANPLTSTIAAEGVRRLGDGLRGVSRDVPGAREELQFGSFLAGLVFAAAGSGLHHKICHALGGAFDLPHAGTHTVILPHVLRFNASAAPEAAAAIASALRADDAVDGLTALIVDTGAPRTLRGIGMRAADVPRAVDIVAEKLPIDNPRDVTRDSIEELLVAAYDREDDHDDRRHR